MQNWIRKVIYPALWASDIIYTLCPADLKLQREIEGLAVAYFDHHLGATHSGYWSKYAFLQFFMFFARY